MPINAKLKGKIGELEAAREVSRLFHTATRRGQQYRGGSDSPDVIAEKLELHFEVKRCERLSLWKALEQAVTDSRGKTPVVLHRRNRSRWVAIMYLDDLPRVVRAVNKTQPLIYLASPYNHTDDTIRRWRHEAVCRALAVLYKRGYLVYSAIAHNFSAAKIMGEENWEAWRDRDLAMLRRADELWVLTLPGWEHSTGVAEELAAANKLGLRITYLSPEEVGIVAINSSDNST